MGQCCGKLHCLPSLHQEQKDTVSQVKLSPHPVPSRRSSDYEVVTPFEAYSPRSDVAETIDMTCVGIQNKETNRSTPVDDHKNNFLALPNTSWTAPLVKTNTKSGRTVQRVKISPLPRPSSPLPTETLHTEILPADSRNESPVTSLHSRRGQVLHYSTRSSSVRSSVLVRIATNKAEPRHTGGPKHQSREVTVLKRNDSFLLQSASSSELDRELSNYASRKLEVEKMPAVDTLAAPKLCSTRLQHIIDLLEGDKVIDKTEMIENLKYSIAVLDTLYIEETKLQLQRKASMEPIITDYERRLFDDDDALNEVEPDAVPSEVRDWLAQTFTRSQSVARVRGDRPKLKSVAQAVRAGLMVERIYRRMSSFNESSIQPPTAVCKMLKDIDQWSFNVFEFDELSGGNSLRYMGYELLRTQGLISKLRINYVHLDNFLQALQAGYSKYSNPYHNLIHAADVAQTTYTLLQNSGLMRWLTDIEIFATIIAALIHDYEHTGTTNNFHIMSGTPLAMLYNDRAVLENHHVCAAFELLRSDDKNILIGLKKEEYREFRALVIDMVLATDMSGHFQQIKNMKSMLTCAENLEKSKALSLILHTADIGHPSKPWVVHKRWTDNLIEEFFKQGDREKQLGIPCSPLCDRQTTLVEKSQIGFIDFIVEPSYNVLGDMMERIVDFLQHKPNKDMSTQSNAILEDVNETGDSNHLSNNHSSPSPIQHEKHERKMVKYWLPHLEENRAKWKKLAGIEEDEENGDKNNNPEEKPPIKAITRSTSTTGLRRDSGELFPPPPTLTKNTRGISKQTSTTGISAMSEYVLSTSPHNT